MTKNKVFLETTIQISRISGDEDRKKEIDKILFQFKKIITSTYVKMEFRRRLIRDLVYTNNILQDSKNYAEIYKRVEKLPPEQNRKIKGFLSSSYRFFSESSKDKVSGSLDEILLEKSRSYFKKEVEEAWYKFNKKIEEILDETGCYLAKSGPILEGDKYDNTMKKCKTTEIKCKIVEFLVQNKEIFEKIYLKLQNIPEAALDTEQIKIKNILGNVLKHPEYLSDKKNCWNCGDAIITVESPDDAKIFTTNVKHFEPLCDELGKKLVPT